jgi:hypothetical protein
MIEGRGTAGLSKKASAGGLAVGCRPQHLERDLSMEVGVVRQKYDTHPTAAEGPLDSISAKADPRLQFDVRRQRIFIRAAILPGLSVRS